MQGSNPECCIICGRSKPSGIMVRSCFICTQCEQDIVEATVEKQTKYTLIREGLKELWK